MDKKIKSLFLKTQRKKETMIRAQRAALTDKNIINQLLNKMRNIFPICDTIITNRHKPNRNRKNERWLPLLEKSITGNMHIQTNRARNVDGRNPISVSNRKIHNIFPICDAIITNHHKLNRTRKNERRLPKPRGTLYHRCFRGFECHKRLLA